MILSAIVAVSEEAAFALVTPLFGLPWFKPTFVATLRDVLPIDFHLNLIIYWLTIGIFQTDLWPDVFVNCPFCLWRAFTHLL